MPIPDEEHAAAVASLKDRAQVAEERARGSYVRAARRVLELLALEVEETRAEAVRDPGTITDGRLVALERLRARVEATILEE